MSINEWRKMLRATCAVLYRFELRCDGSVQHLVDIWPFPEVREDPRDRDSLLTAILTAFAFSPKRRPKDT